jgi:hypothetical protein
MKYNVRSSQNADPIVSTFTNRGNAIVRELDGRFWNYTLDGKLIATWDGSILTHNNGEEIVKGE